MALTNVVYKEEFSYIETIEGLTPEMVETAKQQFEEYKARGVIISGSFDALEWVLTNQVIKSVSLKFAINAVRYKADDLSSKLGCSYEDCLQALHTFAVMQLHFALKSISRSIHAIVDFINKQELPKDYTSCSAVRSFLEFLPDYTAYTEEVIDLLYNKNLPLSGVKSDPRELMQYQSYFRFDHYLSCFWRTGSEEERVMYFPVWLWWTLTSIIPLRVTEFILTPRNCIRTENGERLLALRRTKLKTNIGTARHTIADDYELCEYPVPDKLADSIQWYINVTADKYQSDIDTLFCKTAQFHLAGVPARNDCHYTAENLKQILSRFYSNVLQTRYGLQIRDRGAYTPLGKHEIEFINLGDTRHIACIGLMVSGNDVSTVRELARHSDIQTGANYYSSVTKFMNAMILEHYSPESESPGSITSLALSGGFLSNVEQYEEVTGGRCTSARFKEGNYSHCASAVSPVGELGKCEYCMYFFPDAHMVRTSKHNAERQLMAACEILAETLQNRSESLGYVSLQSAFSHLQAAESQYLKTSAIEKLFMEEQDERKQKWQAG